MKSSKSIVALLGALSLGVLGGFLLSQYKPHPADSAGQREPLYWVAPMDDSYRRDKPGKSPMGMDLVPVYEDSEQETSAADSGDVRINPTVEHNLGIKLAEVRQRAFSQPIETVGLVEVNQQQVQHFHVRASGWVTQLAVAAEGDPVRKGEKLFEFYSPEIVNLQKEYLQGIRENRAEQTQSSIAQLQAKGVSEREINRLVRTREIRERIHYYADRDGYVVVLGVREGNFVDLDQNLLSIGSLENIWVNVEVFEQQAKQLTTTQAATLTTDAYPGEDWQGSVDYVYPMLDPVNRTLRARLIIPNRDGKLKPGMFARVEIATQTRQAVLSVPRSAVIRTASGERVVKQIEPGVYRSVTIKTGESNQHYIEVLDGLSAEDKVVVDGQFLIDSESHIDTALEQMQPPAKASEASHDHETMNHAEMDTADEENREEEGAAKDDIDHESMDHGGHH